MPKPENETSPQNVSDGGLYKNLNLSTRTLGIVILAGILALLLLVFAGSRNGGFVITFHPRGGSDVSPQKYTYQQPLEWPEDPSREGYTFDGWALDEQCSLNAEPGMEVEGAMDLYACWSPIESH